MYLSFFGFKEPPFKLTPDPRFFFFSKKHQEAFSHILYGLKERKGFIVVTGEVGTGKTTLCRLLLDKLDPSIRTALLFNPQLSPIELLQSVNQDFGLKGEGTSKKGLLDELNRFLLDLLAKGENALLIVDEAQLLTVECLEEIRLLSNLETDREKLIQILLIGQPELRETLAKKEIRQLKQRISLSYEIGPLSREEVASYLQARLAVAGGKDKVRFAPKGIDSIYRFSGGFPRLINIAAEQALLAAYVANTATVSEAIVRRAIDELKKQEGGSAPQNRKGLLWGLSLSFVFLLLLAGLWGWREGFLPPWEILAPKEPPPIVERPIVESQAAPPTVAAPSPPPLAAPSTGESAISTEPKDRTVESPSPPVSAVAPPSSAVLPPAPAPSPAPSSLLDGAGVFRVERLSETEKGATLTLLNLWSPLAPDGGWKEKDPPEIRRWMEERGLRSVPVPLDLDPILFLNYPLLFSTPEKEGDHFQVLAAVEGEEAVLLDPLSGKKKAPLAKMAKGWRGKGLIFWSPIEGVRLPFREGADPSVRKIQEILRSEGLFLGKPDGIWGPRTRRAVRFFQEREGLEEDGVFGTETHLLLARRVRPETPALR